MDKTPSDYIALDRWFRPHSETTAPDEEAAKSYLSWGRSHACGWPDVIGKGRVHVVLGEAGSGRTYEFKAKANSLRSEGKIALYLSLHKLATEPFEEQLDAQERSVLAAWKSGEGDAYLFLDAVDESKLTKVSHFRDALNKVGTALGEAVPRAHVFISSRVKDWLPNTDRRHVIEALDLVREPKSQASEDDEGDEEHPSVANHSVQVWVICALERHQVKAYVEGRGGVNSTAFIQALDDAYAWELTARPLDVNLLFEYWRKHSRIGRPTEMFEHLVAAQLIERPEKMEYDRAYPLESGRARLGAETLAAATVFCRRLDFRIPDEQFALDSSTALDAGACLPDDWKHIEIHALLSRPLFDAAIYGSTRFHHRSIAEYLAACWLRRLLRHECPIDEVLDLFFELNRGRLVAKQSRLPVAVWLACVGDESSVSLIRQRLLTTAPEAFLRFGDPSQLPSVFKRQILDGIVNRYEGREMVRFETSEVALNRMGEPDLAEALTRHLASGQVSEALKIEFVKLARIGRVSEGVPVALQLLHQPNLSSGLSSHCMWLVEELGTPAQLQEMGGWVASLPQLSCDHCWQALEMLYPVYLTPQQLASLLTRLSNPQKAGDHLSYSLLHKFSHVTELSLAASTLRCLLDLIERPPLLDRLPVSQQFTWVAKVIKPLIKKLVSSASLPLELQTLAARSLWIITQDSINDDSDSDYDEVGAKRKKETAATLTHQHPAVRRELFWLHFRNERGRREDGEAGGTASWIWHHYLKLYQVSDQDFEWLLLDLANQPLEDERLGVLSNIVEYWKTTGRHRSVKRRIEAAIANSPVLSASFRAVQDWPWLTRIRYWWQRQKWDGFRNKYWWDRRWSRIVGRYHRFQDSEWLYRHLSDLRNGQAWATLGNLVGENGFDSKWAPKNWDKLLQKRGKRITAATQQGCVAVWMSFDPASMVSTPNSVSHRIIAGLAGLQYLWQSGRAKFEAWPERDVERATRYALEEMNGFSDWLPKLAEYHPEAVIRVLSERIEGEWSGSEQTGGSRVLDRLYWTKSNLGRLMVPVVLDHLTRRNPESHAVLSTAIRLLIKHSEAANDVYARLASQGILGYRPDESCFKLWLLVWLQSDTTAALDCFDQTIQSHAITEEQARELAVGLCAGLNSRMDREIILPHVEYRDPNVALRFIRWVYLWVNEAYDIHRGSGSYSPVPRDDAQMFRDGLPGQLANLNTPEGETVLMQLLLAPELQGSRDYILHLMDELLRRLADGYPWNAAAIREFSRSHQALPLSVADLFGIARRRLRIIKSEVEAPDDTITSPYVREGDDESGLRRFLALRLEQLSRGMYSSTQEAVNAAERRPDLRIARAGIVGQVPIEVKLADNRSLTSLLDDLRLQLVGDYLSNYQSRYGLFVVGLTRSRDHWLHPVTGEHLPFLAMIQYLQQHALELLAEGGIALGLEVVGINFCPRPSARA